MDTLKIGFANLDERNPFAVAVRESLQQAEAQAGDVQVIYRDNALDTDKAMANAQDFVREGVDVAIVFHIDQRASFQVIQPLRTAQIPVIAVDLPINGAFFYGINNEQAGQVAGESTVRWVQEHWGGQVGKVLCLTEQRVLGPIQQRFTGVIGALTHHCNLDMERVLYIDNGDNAEVSAERTAEVLARWQNDTQIVVICINDSTARGVIDAVRANQRTADVAIVSYDGTDVARAAFDDPALNFIVSPYIQQHRYGPELIALCRRLGQGELIPANSFVDSIQFDYSNFHELRP